MEFTRQLGVIDPMLLPTITLIGAGGIGSPTALALSKMGIPTLNVFDDDEVEEHNQPTTFYRHDQVGQSKVSALKQIIEEQTLTNVNAYPTKVDAGTLFSGVIISGVDTMTARAAILDAVLLSKEHVPLYIEARMEAECGIIHTLNPSDETEVIAYRTNICDEKDASIVPCTERAVAYNVFVIGGIIAALVKKFAKGEELPLETDIDLVNLMIMTGDTRIVGENDGK